MKFYRGMNMEALRATKRQDRKYKRFCKECKKSQRTTFTREGALCPRFHLIPGPFPPRTTKGVVDTKKEGF